MELAELNAELFASYGEDDDVDAFRAEVQKNMEKAEGAIVRMLSTGHGCHHERTQSLRFRKV